jgi:hypothetical protein
MKTEKGGIMAKILRWHINRLLEGEAEPVRGTRSFSVIITPQAEDKDIFRLAGVDDPRELGNIKNDTLDWWDMDDENEIEGVIEERDLIRALTEKNVSPISELTETVEKETDVVMRKRKIDEDMVFLQIVEDEKNLADILEGLRKDGPFPDVTGLAALGDDLWLDFTQQARKMAADQYQKVMGEI